MFELLDEKLIFKDINGVVYKFYLSGNADKLNTDLEYLLSRFISCNYYYDFIENLSLINNLFNDLQCSLMFELLKKDNNEFLEIKDLFTEYTFLEIYSMQLEVRTFFSKPREIFLKMFLQSCKV